MPRWLKDAGCQKPLLVTDKSIAQLDLCQDLYRSLSQNDLDPYLYDEAEGNPVKMHVDRGVEKYKSSDCDCVLMLGGGCALDVGKAIALMVRHPGDLFDYEDGKEDARPVDQKIPFMLAIPTTAGTGSEVGASSVISDDQTHAKVIIWSPRLMPNLVVADPCLTVSLPPNLTAATGMDALTHNIEAYLAKSYHPICEGIALEGINLVFQHLENAYRTPDSLEARKGMLMASMMGAIAFQKGLGVTHSMAHALSTCYDLHHGLANAVSLRACLQFNREAIPEKFSRIASSLGLSGTKEQLGSIFIEKVTELKNAVGMSKSLKDLGIDIGDKLITTAFNDSCHQNNPRACTREDFYRLFQES